MTALADGPVDVQALTYARELGQLHRLRRAYERLVPVGLEATRPEVTEPVVRVATVLFTDLRGFTAIGERFADDPGGLLAVLNTHLEAVIHAVSYCGGVVEKFVGDGIMATFGARDDMMDHSERALAAALAVIGANEAINRRHSASWGFRLDMSVGVAAGKIVVGTVGSRARSELGVLGDPINVAARLVRSARPGEILLAGSVYRGVADSVRAELLGQSAIRGRRAAVEVYRIAFLNE